MDARRNTKGRSSPLGVSVSADGANFSVYSKHATSVDLLLFDAADDTHPSRVIPIYPATNRTYHYWHVFVPGVKAGQSYGYRVSGAFDPANGMRFNPLKILLDPYGLAVAVPQTYSREAARIEGDN
ncbi:MAG TPA: glycogen debranching enzyme, partial [Candidatus Binatia bacterium]|nr:glycogen debranching enzyme [Candidatus Binatia bacterium]